MTKVEKVISGITHHMRICFNNRCDGCPYSKDPNCFETLRTDATETLNKQRWIPVEEALPEEYETIFAKYKGTPKWDLNMPEKMSESVHVIKQSDGRKWVSTSYTMDGKWEAEKYEKCKVTHWMQNPTVEESEAE